MPTISQWLDRDSLKIHAYGTSEGVEKGWETREHGGHTEQEFDSRLLDALRKRQINPGPDPAAKDDPTRYGFRSSGTSEGVKKGWDARGRSGKSESSWKPIHQDPSGYNEDTTAEPTSTGGKTTPMRKSHAPGPPFYGAASMLGMRLMDYLEAYGTSEGANKGWDSRGRGRAKKNFEPPSSTVEHKFGGRGDYADRQSAHKLLTSNGYQSTGPASYSLKENPNVKLRVNRDNTYSANDEDGAFYNGELGDLPKFIGRHGQNPPDGSGHVDEDKQYTGPEGEYRRNVR